MASWRIPTKNPLPSGFFDLDLVVLGRRPPARAIVLLLIDRPSAELSDWLPCFCDEDRRHAGKCILPRICRDGTSWSCGMNADDSSGTRAIARHVALIIRFASGEVIPTQMFGRWAEWSSTASTNTRQLIIQWVDAVRWCPSWCMHYALALIWWVRGAESICLRLDLCGSICIRSDLVQ